jgi:molybdopterin molybdotransferase
MTFRRSKHLLLNVQSAREIVLEACQKVDSGRLRSESLALLDCVGRTIAEPIMLDRDQPPFDRSMRDGYAVRAQDVGSVPASLKCVGEVKAGEWPSMELHQGEAVQIMTGAPAPAQANAVVMVEYTEQPSPGWVTVLRSVRQGENIAPQGSEHRAGGLVFGEGTRLSAFELAVLATVGKSTVKVFRRPSVAILATGDELVDIQETPAPSQIRNSNSYSLYAQVLQSGGVPKILKIARDNLPDLRRQIALGIQEDVLLISGGVSMGKYDLVEPALSELGVQVHFDSVNMRPGKPTVFATRGNHFVFGLPGNPVSTFVAFELFVRPVLRSLQGLKSNGLTLVKGIVEREVVEKSGRTAFLPARVTSRAGKNSISAVAWKGSADIFSVVGANGFLIVPLETSHFTPGDEAEAVLFDRFQSESEGRF